MRQPEPYPEFRRFAGLPWRWWRHLPHLVIPVFVIEDQMIRCSICWRECERLHHVREPKP